MFASHRPLIRLALLIVLAVFGSAPSLAQEDRLLCVHGIAPPEQLNVRSAPDSNAPVVARFPANACGVRVAGRCTAGWCEMSLNGAGGWVYTKNIAVYDVPRGHPSTQSQATLPAPVEVEQGSGEPAQCVARVDRGDTLRIRTGPGVGHDEIGGIPPGACDVARVGGCRGPWCKVVWRGRTGWVNTYYLD